MRRLAAALIAVGALGPIGAVVACSAGPAPVAREASDPSNPNAPEGVDPVAALHVSSSAAPGAGPTVYACPMHPDMRSDHAGHCPTCGMALVPRR